MKREIPKTTFVGPITKRAKSYSFLILQGGVDPIKLEYSTQMVSRQSRAQLLETHHTYPVPSTKLLMAIQQALNEEHGTPLQQHPNAWDERMSRRCPRTTTRTVPRITLRQVPENRLPDRMPSQIKAKTIELLELAD